MSSAMRLLQLPMCMLKTAIGRPSPVISAGSVRHPTGRDHAQPSRPPGQRNGDDERRRGQRHHPQQRRHRGMIDGQIQTERVELQLLEFIVQRRLKVSRRPPRSLAVPIDDGLIFLVEQIIGIELERELIAELIATHQARHHC